MLTRLSVPQLEVRASQRVVFGTLVPYSVATEIREARGTYQEQFAPGAFSELVRDKAMVGRVRLMAQHDHRSLPLGKAVEMSEDRSGLHGGFRVSKTTAGDEALELIADGSVDAFSIGFEPLEDDWSNRRDKVVRKRARLREVSLVVWPAYEGAVIAGVRSKSDLEAEARARSRSRLSLALTRSKSA